MEKSFWSKWTCSHIATPHLFIHHTIMISLVLITIPRKKKSLKKILIMINNVCHKTARGWFSQIHHRIIKNKNFNKTINLPSKQLEQTISKKLIFNRFWSFKDLFLWVIASTRKHVVVHFLWKKNSIRSTLSKVIKII